MASIFDISHLSWCPKSNNNTLDSSERCKFEHPGQPTAGSGNRFGALGGAGFRGVFPSI